MNRYIYKILSLVFFLFYIFCLIQFISTNAFRIRDFRAEIDAKLVLMRITILFVSFSLATFFYFIDRKKNR